MRWFLFVGELVVAGVIIVGVYQVVLYSLRRESTQPKETKDENK